MVVDETTFFGSQVGGRTVIDHNYTNHPFKLLFRDALLLFQNFRSIPSVVHPIFPYDSASLDELAPTRQNLRCIAIHAILCVLQIIFLLFLPFAVVLPVWCVVLGVAAILSVNSRLTSVLNAKTRIIISDEEYAVALPEHDHEQWIFLNGIAVGEHWLKSHVNRLALTFKRPVLGVHNRTRGIVFDILECLIQRCFNYATDDARECYRVVKDRLYNPRVSRVILILHSQGGIIGGLAIDWLLQELPQDLLTKLEVYTFGNAANHLNNPHRHVLSQRLAQEDPACAVATTTTTVTSSSPGETPEATACSSPLDSILFRRPEENSISSIHTLSAAQDRAIGYIEHYAHTTDFISLWGILHFVCGTTPSDRQKNGTIPRFMGRVFARHTPRGGHQFVQHYLDGMFPLVRDPMTGSLTGAADRNEFMETLVEVGNDTGHDEDVREAFEISWMGRNGFGSARASAEIEVLSDSDSASGLGLGLGIGGSGSKRIRTRGTVKVKDLSRLWQYRNGRSPVEIPPFLITGKKATL